MTVDVQKFRGGGAWIASLGGLGALALAVTLAGMAWDPKPLLFSYLVAFAFWAGVGLGSLVLLMIFHAFHAKWMVIIRRPLEAMAATILALIPLFVPIALGMEHLYPWVDPGHAFNHEELELLHKKAPYLNLPFFLIRTAIYFVVAGFISRRLFGWSTTQDASGDAALTVRQRRLATGALPLVAVVFAFAAFDWLMTLNPLWFSTIFGVYYFAGSFLTAVSILLLVCVFARGKDLFGDYVTPEHTHNLGKLMLAFTSFWAYIAFSQFMLVWVAGLPEEVPFYTVRLRGPWSVVGLVLIFGHFFLPFGALLSRELKRRPRALAVVAAWILFINFVDLYWLVLPTLHPEGPVFHWSLLTAFLGVGGLVSAAAIFKLRGHFTVPVKDPFLSVSLRYRQP